LSGLWAQRSARSKPHSHARARRAGWRALALGALLALAGLATAPSALARDVVRVESVGVAPVRPNSASPRDAAVRAALRDAVQQTAEGLLAPPVGEEVDEEAGAASDQQAEAEQTAQLQQILGNDPLVYATRFQVVEDRGEGPTLFGSDSDVDTEYVVIVSVFVDRDRIRERLTRAGVALAPAGQEPEIHSRLIIENLSEYWVYAEIRKALLEELKMRSAIPSAMSPGRAVLELNGTQTPNEFLGELQRAVSDRMALIPLNVADDELRVRVEAVEPPAPGEGAEAPAEIDTGSPNRY
jgi:hypothetical protein